MRRLSVVPVMVLLATCLPMPAQEKVALPKGEGPRFFIVLAINAEGIDIQRVNPPTKSPTPPDPIRHRTTFNKVETTPGRSEQVRATDATGKALTPEEVTRRLKPGSIVLVSEDVDPIDPVYLAVVKADTVVLTWVEPRRFGTAGQPQK